MLFSAEQTVINLNSDKMTKQTLQFLQYTRQFSLGFLFIGGVFYVDHFPFSTFFLTVGGLGFACYCFLSAFKPIHEEPNWELVYPELALGEFEEELTAKTDDHDTAGK